MLIKIDENLSSCTDLALTHLYLTFSEAAVVFEEVRKNVRYQFSATDD